MLVVGDYCQYFSNQLSYLNNELLLIYFTYVSISLYNFLNRWLTIYLSISFLLTFQQLHCMAVGCTSIWELPITYFLFCPAFGYYVMIYIRFVLYLDVWRLFSDCIWLYIINNCIVICTSRDLYILLRNSIGNILSNYEMYTQILTDS